MSRHERNDKLHYASFSCLSMFMSDELFYNVKIMDLLIK
jgi:hypothetical protein